MLSFQHVHGFSGTEMSQLQPPSLQAGHRRAPCLSCPQPESSGFQHFSKGLKTDCRQGESVCSEGRAGTWKQRDFQIRGQVGSQQKCSSKLQVAMLYLPSAFPLSLVFSHSLLHPLLLFHLWFAASLHPDLIKGRHPGRGGELQPPK